MEIVLDGAGFWECIEYSQARYVGMMIYGGFLMFVPLVVVNALIAMMADTYSSVIQKSFMNYIFAFGKVLVEYRTAPVVAPFNLLSIPYHVCTNMAFLAGFVRVVIVPGAKEPDHRKEPSQCDESLNKELNAVLLSILESDMAAPEQGRVCITYDNNEMHMYHPASLKQVYREHDDMKTPIDVDTINQGDAVTHALRGHGTVTKVERPGEMQRKREQFEKSIARFCRAQEDGEDPPTLEEMREMVKEEVDNLQDQQLRKIQAVLNGEEIKPKSANEDHEEDERDVRRINTAHGRRAR